MNAPSDIAGKEVETGGTVAPVDPKDTFVSKAAALTVSLDLHRAETASHMCSGVPSIAHQASRDNCVSSAIVDLVALLAEMGGLADKYNAEVERLRAVNGGISETKAGEQQQAGDPAAS